MDKLVKAIVGLFVAFIAFYVLEVSLSSVARSTPSLSVLTIPITLGFLLYSIYGIYNEGLTMMRARSFATFVVAFVVFALDLYLNVGIN